MRKSLTLLFILVVLLLAGCASTQPLQNDITSPVYGNLFYESWDSNGYNTKNLKIENGIVTESAEKWIRGFAEAISVDPAEKLVQELNFKDYTKLELAYGQLYYYGG